MIKFLVAAMLLVGLVSCGKEESCCQQPAKPGVERMKDPVCGMWVNKDAKSRADVGTAMFDKGEYFFCAKECLIAFTGEPTKYVRACKCANLQRNCDCGHCAGKFVPCDCE